MNFIYSIFLASLRSDDDLYLFTRYFIFHVFFSLLLFLAPAPVTETPIDLAEKCDSAECVLPYCFCSKDGTVIPGGLEPADVS